MFGNKIQLSSSKLPLEQTSGDPLVDIHVRQISVLREMGHIGQESLVRITRFGWGCNGISASSAGDIVEWLNHLESYYMSKSERQALLAALTAYHAALEPHLSCWKHSQSTAVWRALGNCVARLLCSELKPRTHSLMKPTHIAVVRDQQSIPSHDSGVSNLVDSSLFQWNQLKQNVTDREVEVMFGDRAFRSGDQSGAEQAIWLKQQEYFRGGLQPQRSDHVDTLFKNDCAETALRLVAKGLGYKNYRINYGRVSPTNDVQLKLGAFVIAMSACGGRKSIVVKDAVSPMVKDECLAASVLAELEANGRDKLYLLRLQKKHASPEVRVVYFDEEARGWRHHCSQDNKGDISDGTGRLTDAFFELLKTGTSGNQCTLLPIPLDETYFRSMEDYVVHSRVHSDIYDF